ncbi:myoferlin [Anopheles nili]|uniref:myoferlin n=1 Tax=Anopheles nili TaxID=185578 RepID=UPI00237C50CF|nr:myoferlin [Anopheles nili]
MNKIYILQELLKPVGIFLKDQNRYPDLILYLSRPGHSSVDAIARFNMAHYMLASKQSDSLGVQCDERCATLMRSIHCNHSCPDRCGCIYAKLDYVMQIGTEQQTQVNDESYSVLSNHSSRVVATPIGLVDRNTITKHVHCKVHVYRGRIFAGSDKSELCNAKLVVLFEEHEMALSTIRQTLSPCWNETVEFRNAQLTVTAGALDKKSELKTTLIFILQNEGKNSKTIGLGWLETSINPNTEPQMVTRAMRWIPIFRKGIRIAEILASNEFAEVVSSAEGHEEMFDVEKLVVHGLPDILIPEMSAFKLEVFFVGLRQMVNDAYQKIRKSRILITLGDASIMSGNAGNIHGSCANFPEGHEFCNMRLPTNPHFWPSLIITHMDYSNSSRVKMIGLAVVNASELLTESPAYAMGLNENTTIIEVEEQDDVPLLQPEDTSNRVQFNALSNWSNISHMVQTQLKFFSKHTTLKKRISHSNEHSWWAKFYNSIQQNNNTNSSLKIFDRELESITEFNGFKDWSESFSLFKIKRDKADRLRKQMYGMVKCKINIHRLLPEKSQLIPPLRTRLMEFSKNIEIIVVVYVVQALNLTSRDIMSESDAYIVVAYGGQRVRDRAYYIPNQASPVFGRRFEMRGTLPRDQILHISIYDRDFVSSDDLIGSTCIDIEDRFRSKHVPAFGLPSFFTSKGSNCWRHQMKPSDMLRDLCSRHRISFPRIEGQKIIVGDIEMEADELDPTECLKEQLCLQTLNNFQHVRNGFPLTPEHVETRSLYHPKRAGIEQGKVQLWIELYEPNEPHPQPVDITPQPPKAYDLRVIVWNTTDVMLNERNIFGTPMSDIYVKCWLQEYTEAQHTDVHYRSLTGEGNFNWRMIFPFRYSPADGMLVLRRKKAFYEQHDTELKYPPVLTVQIWDNDSFSADDFLGTAELNLSQLPTPASTADACTLSKNASLTGSGSNRGLNLFHHSKVRGWFPVHGRSTSENDASDRQPLEGEIALTGKIELELEILSHDDATLDPVGVGRNPPQHLPEPLRPEVSFNWLQQPAKSFNKLVWPRVRKSFLYVGAIVLLCLLAYGIVVNMPTVFLVRSLEQRSSTMGTSSDGAS